MSISNYHVHFCSYFETKHHSSTLKAQIKNEFKYTIMTYKSHVQIYCVVVSSYRENSETNRSLHVNHGLDLFKLKISFIVVLPLLSF